MKKIISLVLFVFSLATYFWLSDYTRSWPFDYHVSETFGYLVIWLGTLFISSLFAFILPNDKYKKWLKFTCIYVAVALLVAYIGRDPGNDWMSPDGEQLTKFFAGLYASASIIYCGIVFIRKK